MSKVSALDHVYTAGMKAERHRLLASLDKHLRTEHGWDNYAIEQAVKAVSDNAMLNKPVKNAVCAVCNQKYSGDEETKPIYGQPIHESCIEDMTGLINLFIKEEK